MWRNCEDSDWELYSKILNRNIFFDLNFINDVAKSYSLKIEKFIYKKGEKVLGMCAIYIFENRIVTPDWFIDTPIYIDGNKGEEIYLNVLETLIALFNDKFKDVFIRLPIDFYDIRPYIWNGYDVKIKYTHIKDNNLVYHKSVIKRLKSLKNIDRYIITSCEFSEEGLNLILKFQRKFGVSEREITKNMQFFNSQKNNKNIRFFNLYEKESGILFCSQIILIDKINGKLYFLMISDVQSRDKGIHTYLHDYILNWAKNEGIEQIDFCGANIKSISIFKSYFGTVLKSYYYVEKINFFRRFLKKLLNK